ncbi:MAG: hypothetical protein ACE5E0_03320 [Terriglobia bacterium]
MFQLGIYALMFATFAINLPFGFFRQYTRKFSLWWFLAIHAPIPLVFLARTYLGYTYLVIPLLLIAAVGGQIVGARVKIR